MTFPYRCFHPPPLSFSFLTLAARSPPASSAVLRLLPLFASHCLLLVFSLSFPLRVVRDSVLRPLPRLACRGLIHFRAWSSRPAWCCYRPHETLSRGIDPRRGECDSLSLRDNLAASTYPPTTSWTSTKSSYRFLPRGRISLRNLSLFNTTRADVASRSFMNSREKCAVSTRISSAL